jgi:hypothetical protein
VAAIPPPAAAAAADAYARHRSDLFWAGDIIDGRFQVIKRLADGGFAVVYSATDLTTHDEVTAQQACCNCLLRHWPILAAAPEIHSSRQPSVCCCTYALQ